ncbi:CDP-alcohol phosphatidyltransferase family protein [bacterium]|nr:CDP-alcohol phosphatidyltransferase family protein [bacterium]
MSTYLWSLVIANSSVIVLAIYFGIFVYPKQELSEETKRRPRSFVSNAFFREFWYFLMGPLKRKLIKWGASPNTLTIAGFIFSLAAGVAFGMSEFGLGGWMVILAATCDIYDGQLARARGIDLKSGAFLDSVLDRLGESAMFCGLAWHFKDNSFWFLVLFITFTASQLVSYSRARAEGLGFLGARGFFQRAERMIVMSIGMCLIPVFEEFFQSGQAVLFTTVAFLCLGSSQTAITRAVAIFKDIRATEK